MKPKKPTIKELETQLKQLRKIELAKNIKVFEDKEKKRFEGYELYEVIVGNPGKAYCLAKSEKEAHRVITSALKEMDWDEVCIDGESIVLESKIIEKQGSGTKIRYYNLFGNYPKDHHNDLIEFDEWFEIKGKK